MKEDGKTENTCLWMLKGISCILVVLFHCPLPSLIGDGIIYAFRFPVPIFFLISGYYSLHANVLGKAGQIARLIFKAELLYGLELLVLNFFKLIDNMPVMQIEIQVIVKKILFGTFFNGTLWYLYAMFWTWVFLFFLSEKSMLMKCGYCLIILLLVCNIIGRMYMTKYYDINQYVFLFRSCILFALPFTLAGRLIAENKNMMMGIITLKRSGILVMAGSLLIIMEYVLWHQFMDMHFSTIFVSIGLFMFALHKPRFSLLKKTEYIGRNLSKYIYILHMPVIIGIDAIMKSYEGSKYWGYLRTFLVLIITLVLSQLLSCFDSKAARHNR